MGNLADPGNNAIEAVDGMERQRRDAMLMDVQMQGMCALQASRRVTAGWRPNERPHVVAMAVEVMQGDREE